MFAKKFFYVCAGLFLLAGAYAIGARNAGAQSSAMVCAGVGRLPMAVGSDGQVFQMYADGAPIQYTNPVPNVDVRAIEWGSAIGSAAVVCGNGDVYTASSPTSAWVLRGSLFAGLPVNVEKHTLGQLKARFR